MMPYGWHGGAWGYIMMFGSWAFIALLVYLVVRAVTGSERRDGSPRRGEALRILDERLARGEITEQEYRDRRALLQEERR
jgi:putative membrane protein